ncbi:MAG: T9SS type A sorting domain-containing protein, partial [Bacteroidetes bacterium]
FAVVDDNSGDSFNSLDTLRQYAVVVFSNTSGNAILDAGQQANFEAYIDSGGAYLGIHAATDTYRHSTANGGFTGDWDWYAELTGASVQTGPNHVSGTPLYTMQKVMQHPVTDSLPDPWAKNEEYYYWENGYYNPENNVLLEVEQTVGPNGEVNSYDTIRPMAWYRELPSGSRVFYTALGHATENYTDDTLFQALIRDALLWAAWTDTLTTTSMPPGRLDIRLYPNPAQDVLHVAFSDLNTDTALLRVTDSSGRVCFSTSMYAPNGHFLQEVDCSTWVAGYYLVEVESATKRRVGKVLVRH